MVAPGLDVGGQGSRPEPQIRPENLRPGNRPPIDDALDKQIDAAIELLAAVPFEEVQARGWHFQPNHYYWPLNDIAFLRANPDLWNRPRVPDGIEWDMDAQERLLREVTAYLSELGDVRDRPPAAPGEFVWGNDSLPRGDAAVYYGLLRHLAPKHVVEVGRLVEPRPGASGAGQREAHRRDAGRAGAELPVPPGPARPLAAPPATPPAGGGGILGDARPRETSCSTTDRTACARAAT